MTRYFLCSEFWNENVFDSPAGSSFGSVLVQKLPCPPAPLSTKFSHVAPQFGHLYSWTLSSEYPRLPACISSRVEPPTGTSFVLLGVPTAQSKHRSSIFIKHLRCLAE